MPVAPTTYGLFPSVAVGTPPMYYQGEAEADERPPRCDVFDEPLRREDYVQTEHCGGEHALPMYPAEASYPDQPVYGVEQLSASSIPSPRKPYRVHPHVCHEQQWAAAQASFTVVPSLQRQEPPMQAFQPEPGFGQRQEERRISSYPQTVGMRYG